MDFLTGSNRYKEVLYYISDQLQGCTIPKLTIPNGQGYGYVKNCSSTKALSLEVGHSCQIHFRCNGGFVMTGSPTITCYNGGWNVGEEGPPTCKIKYRKELIF